MPSSSKDARGRATRLLKVVLFSGGRGSGVLTRQLLGSPSIALTIAINGYDDGASTGEVRRLLGDGWSARKTGPRMKQITLPLDIVNKGRFDKSEPTIHKGEDLDLPTYVRRGVALN